MDQLQIKFTHSNTVRDKKPYTIYEIELRSNNTIQWVIYKRYSHFDLLHNTLLKSNLSNIVKSKLPLLPPKRLTRSLASEFVEKRKIELEEYVCKLIEINEILHHSIFLNFIECPDTVRTQLQQYTTQYNNLLNDTVHSLNDLELNSKIGINLNSLTYDDRRIYELCYELKYHTNKVNSIKQYEEYFFTQRPKLNTESIKHLLTGTDGSTPLYVSNANIQHRDSNASVLSNNSTNSINSRAASNNSINNERSTPGLIHICGDIAYSHVASRAALYLLCRLLDVEKNKDAALFLDIFCTLDLAVLKLLNLGEHILNERGNRTGAFKLLQLLHNNLSTSNNVQHRDFIENVVASQQALTEYNKWSEHISTQSLSLQHTQQHTIDTTLKSISLDNGYKNIAQQCFQSLLNVYHDRSGWRYVQPVASLPKLTDINEQVSVCYKKDSTKDMVLVRCSSILPYTVQQCIEIIGNVRRRKEWDCKFHRGTLIQALDAQHDILHLVFKSFSSPYKYRDFCVLQSYTTTQEGGYVQACRSVTHSLAPEGKEHVRAVLYPTGYIITPLQNQTVNIHTVVNKDSKDHTSSPSTGSNNSNHTTHSPSSTQNTPVLSTMSPSPSVPSLYLPSPQHTSLHSGTIQQLPPIVGTSTDACLLTFIAQMDKESVLIVSPDLLGETNELRNNMNNLKHILALDNGIRTLQPSAHTQHLLSQQTINPIKASPLNGSIHSINQQDKNIQQLALNQNSTKPYPFHNPLPISYNSTNSPNNLKPINITS